MLTEKPIRTLIAARSGLMRNALIAYLRAIPGVEAAAPAMAATALPLMITADYPDACILDADFTDDLPRLLHLLNAQRPDLNCIVLADSLAQATAVVAAGARHALLKGFLDDQLRGAITGSGPPSALRATGASAKIGGASR